MKAVTNAVRLCLTLLRRAAFYTVHRCFGKSDAFIISLVPMVTKTDEEEEDPHVCLVQTALESTLSARVTDCQFTKQRMNANITCDLFVGFL